VRKIPFPPKFCYDPNEPNFFFFLFNHSLSLSLSLCSSKWCKDLQPQTLDVPPKITEPSTSQPNLNSKTQSEEGTPTMILSTHFHFITTVPSPEGETFPDHVHRRWIRWFTLFLCLCCFVSSLSGGSLFQVPTFHALSFISYFTRFFFLFFHSLCFLISDILVFKISD
jgi:hypothetical protein